MSLQINATNLSANYALLSGAVVSLGMSLLCCVVISFIFPDKEKFRWAKFSENITMVDDKVDAKAQHCCGPSDA